MAKEVIIDGVKYVPAIELKDWEILSFYFKGLGNETPLWRIGSYYYDMAIKNPSEHDIHTVLRKSDGVVFSVGDNVTYQPVRKYSWVIDNFFIRHDGILLVRSKNNSNVEIMDKGIEKLSCPLPTPTEQTKSYVLWDELFGILAWKYRVRTDGEMELDRNETIKELTKKGFSISKLNKQINQ